MSSFIVPVDLEHLAGGYAHRPTSAEARARARRAAESVGLGSGDLALDLGGGRGAHAAVWAQRDAIAVVVDPARGMATEAAKQPGVHAVRASSQELPFRDGVAGLVYFHLSIHYGDWRAALDESWRVLAPHGECWIWTMGEQHHRASFLARWFPSIGDIDTARFPDPAGIVGYLEREWSLVETGKDVEHKVKPAGEWRAAVEAGFVSTLQLVAEPELKSGLIAYDEAYPNPDDEVEYDLTFDWIRART